MPMMTKNTGTRNVEIGWTRCSSCCSPRFANGRKWRPSGISPAAQAPTMATATPSSTVRHSKRRKSSLNAA
jgi:hypothetical protein